MDQFYANLWGKKLPVLDSLRQAQLAILRHPDWLTPREQEPLLDDARGLVKKPVPLPGSSDDSQRRSPPLWWAGFVLSGNLE